MKTAFLLLLTLFISGCSMINPGYISSKPDLSKLTPYKSSVSDVENSLGAPAVSQITFNDKVTYKYYYHTPYATVDQAKMIKGDYEAGCQDCGQIVATFKWGEGTDLKNFLLTGLSVSDMQLKTQTNVAFRLLGQHKFTQAYPILLKAAEANYLRAEHTLGVMFINGDGVAKDYKKAAYWFSRAAGARYPPALYDLGTMYKNGEGFTINLDTAKELYIKSANLGYILAIRELIKIYSAEGDFNNADVWIKKYQAGTNR